MKYEFIQIETDAYGDETGNKISTSFRADTLDEVMERMQYFLRGSGFHFEGHLELVSEDADLQDDDSITIKLSEGEEHSPYYYDFGRNKPWDNYSDLPATESYNYLGSMDSPFNLNLDGDYEIKLDSSNVYFNYNNTMAGNPSER